MMRAASALPEFMAILARRQASQSSEGPDEGAGVTVADLLGNPVDGHVLPFEQSLRGFDANSAKILQW
jgi:hypothetical protein